MAERSGPIPSQFNMPDLSGLPLQRERSVVFTVLLGSPPAADRVAQSLLVTYVRLVDKALAEYEEAKAWLAHFAQVHRSGDWRGLMFGIDHLENCISATHRALDYAEALRRREGLPRIDKINLPPRLQRGRLGELRNKIEHLDEELVRGEVREDAVIQIYPREDAIELGDLVLTYRELADAISKLHAIASKLWLTPGEERPTIDR